MSGINYEVISQCGHYLVKQANIGAEYFYSSRLFAVQVEPNEVGHAPGGYRFKTDDCANFVSFLFLKQSLDFIRTYVGAVAHGPSMWYVIYGTLVSEGKTI